MGLLTSTEYGTLDSIKNFDVSIAGAELNVAIGVKRLGHEVLYYSKLGRDLFSSWVLSCLRKNEISEGFIRYSSIHNTGFMFKSKVQDGDPSVYYYRKNSAASTISIEDVRNIDLSDIAILHITGIFPALSNNCLEVTKYLMQKAVANNIHVTYDPNIRMTLWESKEVMIRTLNELAKYATTVLPGISEGRLLTGFETAEEISAFYQELGVKNIIVKLGEKGAFATDGEQTYVTQGYFPNQIIDTVGAGDGFAAGIISAFAEGLSLQEATERGAAIGCIQVMHVGDNEGLPTREQLGIFMKTNKKF